MVTKQWAAILLAGYLGLYRGYTALWSNNQQTPSHIFPYRKETYSQADRASLERGIPFQTQQELSQLLEDYFS